MQDFVVEVGEVIFGKAFYFWGAILLSFSLKTWFVWNKHNVRKSLLAYVSQLQLDLVNSVRT